MLILHSLPTRSKNEKNFRKQTTVSIDDGDQELRSINYYSIEEGKIVDKVEANLHGASLERYIYQKGTIVKIEISKRIDLINESI